MRKLTFAILTLAACGTAGTPAPASPNTEAPAPVHERITAVLGDREVHIGQEGALYEAHADTELELLITADGKLVESEIAIPVAIVPDVVRAAIDGDLVEAALIVTPEGVLYELETRDHEIVVDATGQVVAHEDEEGEDDEDGEADED